MKTKMNARWGRTVPSLSKRAAGPSGAYATDHLRSWMHEGLYDLPHESAILALGCEQAFLAPHLAEYSSDVTVLDSSTDQVAQLARRFPEIAFLPHNPANVLPFAHDTFAAIWCCEVLDRVFDPTAVLREMHRVLAPGGRLLVTVPDHSQMRNVLNALFRWDQQAAPTTPRIRHFTRASLATLARDAGFGEMTLKKGGAVRQTSGEPVLRSLLLRAKKGPGLRLSATGSRRGTRQEETPFTEELAFASRTRAA